MEQQAHEVHLLWKGLLDKAKYLRSEHDLKEKEYGIPWRSAYKVAITSAVSELVSAKICNDKVNTSELAFEVIHNVAQNVKAEADKIQGKNLDGLKVIKERYTLFEKNIIYLKKLLKEPDTSKFDAVKKQTFQ